MKPANKTGVPAAEQVERRAGTEGECDPAKHVPDTGAGPTRHRRGIAYGVAARRNKKEKFTALSATTSHRKLSAGRVLCDSQERGRRDRRNNVAGSTKQTSEL